MDSQPILFVTARPEKALEAERLGYRIEWRSLELLEPQGLDPAEIAEFKARSAFERLSRPVVVEDSGLSVVAWGGFPGALVKWLEKSAGVEKLARMLDGFPDRSAVATSAIAFFDGEKLVSAAGEARGRVAPAPRGSGGFGWDSIFIPEGSDLTFAEMRPEDKDRVSHRRRAWEALSKKVPVPKSK